MAKLAAWRRWHQTKCAPQLKHTPMVAIKKRSPLLLVVRAWIDVFRHRAAAGRKQLPRRHSGGCLRPRSAARRGRPLGALGPPSRASRRRPPGRGTDADRLVQEIVAPVDRASQSLLPFGAVTGATGQEAEPIAEPLAEGIERQDSDPGRGELDRQWQAIERLTMSTIGLRSHRSGRTGGAAMARSTNRRTASLPATRSASRPLPRVWAPRAEAPGTPARRSSAARPGWSR